ncbi:hypothetical protein [Halocella sp. SP3-1]|uniref:hypothetical protein n=1 Tax=Halocella sp. SP3-1 TaxID=2382161 RepID=UPI0013DF3D2F|nr:hypothetical protein [Halocella sp. SP3-1]
MDKNIKWHQNLQIERLLGNIKNNNMKGFYVKTQENLLSLIKELVPVGSCWSWRFE